MKNVLLLCTTMFVVSVCNAQTVVGPQSGSIFANVPIPGSNQSWINAGNVAASDNTYATFGNLANSAGSYTDYLQVTGFGFSIPGGATITGIVVEVERSDPNLVTVDYRVRIVKGGIIGTDDKAGGATYPSSDTYQAYGNAGDQWGETWTPADINASNFGVAIAAKRIATGFATLGQVDHIRITVFYNFTILPVNLISFNAVNNNNKVTLNWTTANEINMTGYEVQRSTDGNNFTTIASISSHNNISTTQYSYDDVDPSGTVLYYRLKMDGLSGYSKYSKIVSVNLGGENRISLYPNPVSADQSLHIANRNNQLLTIRFYDMAGRMLLNKSFNSDEISLSSLRTQKGIMAYQLTDSKGQLVGKGQLLVQ